MVSITTPRKSCCTYMGNIRTIDFLGNGNMKPDEEEL